MPFAVVKSSRGATIIQVLVLSAVLLLGVTALVPYMNSQSREASRVSTKLEILDLQAEVGAALANASVCMANFSGLQIDETRVADPSYVLALPSLRDLSSQGEVLVRYQPIERLSTAVNVRSIELKNWNRVSANVFDADLLVGVTSHVGPLAPMRVSKVLFDTNPASPTMAKAISSCAVVGAATPAGPGAGCRTVNQGSVPGSQVSSVFCASGEQLRSGGASCSTATNSAWVDPKPEGAGGPLGIAWLSINRPILAADGRWGWTAACKTRPNYETSHGPVPVQVYAVCCR